MYEVINSLLSERQNNKKDAGPTTIVTQEMPKSEAEELKKSGVISGGMIPKVDCCTEALSKGVENVVIMDGRIPHSILMELLTDEGAGTMVTGTKK